MVARWAHNPKVAGSSPASATRKDTIKWYPFFMSLSEVMKQENYKLSASNQSVNTCTYLCTYA